MRTNGLLSEFTYVSRYSRPDLGCLSYEDSFRRLVDVVLSVHEDYRDSLVRLARQHILFPSMRGIQFLDGIFSRRERLFNCAGIIIDDWSKVHLVLYLLLCGSGVGFNISKKHVGKLSPVIRPHTDSLQEVHIVEDSVLGWAKALNALIQSYTIPGRGTVVFDYRDISPKGTLLRSCGRPAPGPEPLRNILENVRAKLDSIVGHRPRPIDIHDIICMASHGVVSGGVRRSALISLFDYDDEEMMDSKIGEWYKLHPYRSLANNSFIMTPDIFLSLSKSGCIELYRETLRRCLEYGEPGVVHLPSTDHVVNPCCEIVFYPWIDGVSSYQLCNLSEVSVWNANLYGCSIEDAVRAATIVGTYQSSIVGLYDDVAKELSKRDSLLGVSLTGVHPYVYNYDWKSLAKIVMDTNLEVSERLGINSAARATCIKPSGTVSCLAGNSSGIHPWFESGIRNITMSQNEIAYIAYRSLLERHGVRDMDNIIVPHPFVQNLYVCPFPYTACSATWRDVDALSLLRDVLYMTNNWIRSGYRRERSSFHHSVSCTVMFEPKEIDDISKFIYLANEDYLDKYNQLAFSGISFLSRDNRYCSRISPFCPKDTDESIENLYYRLLDIEKAACVSDITSMITKVVSERAGNCSIGEMNGGCDSDACYLR